MKTLTVLTALVITMSSFTMNPAIVNRRAKPDAAHELGLQVITALRQSSGLTPLFPSLSDFHSVMDKNATVYGQHLSQAKSEFAKQYEQALLPQLNRSVHDIIAEGKKAGIDWTTIQLVRVEKGEISQDQFSTVPVTIFFSAQGKEHRLQIGKVLVFNGELKISQSISLL
jgi:hypothetical protein